MIIICFKYKKWTAKLVIILEKTIACSKKIRFLILYNAFF